jgi:hypothetical protein
MDEKSSSNSIKKLSYAQVVEEIKKCKDFLSRYEKGDPSLPADFNYKETLYTLRYCRLRKNSWKKSERNV